MSDTDVVSRLEERVRRLETTRRRQAVGLMVLGVVAGLLVLGSGPVRAEKEKEEDKEKVAELDRLTLNGPDGTKVHFRVTKFVDPSGLHNRALEILDTKGVRRCRLAWIDVPPGATARRAVTTLGIYRGDNVIQELPID